MFETVDLEVVSVAMSHALSVHELKDRIGMTRWTGYMAAQNMDTLVGHLHSYIWSEKRDDIEYTLYPTWWDHFKATYPGLCRWLKPPKREHREIRVYDGYPELHRPIGPSTRLVLQSGWTEGEDE